LLGHLDGLAAIGGFPTDFPALTLLEQGTQATPYYFMIVGQQNA